MIQKNFKKKAHEIIQKSLNENTLLSNKLKELGIDETDLLGTDDPDEEVYDEEIPGGEDE